MTKSIRKALVGAALTGFMLGATVAASASPNPADDSSTTKIEKHCCAGKNSCKGQGGCGADKGKNSCAGKGGCNTKGTCHNQPCS